MARLQLYYDERKIEGTVSQDAGAMIRDGIKCVSKIGVAHETLWPYNIKKFKSKPSAKVYNNARQEGALTYERVDVNATALKHALADGYPVIIGISVYESFEDDDVAKSGIVPLPSKGEQMIGGHCMYVVGYGQKKGYFTVRNSWADDWGDAGDCYIPEKYLGNQNLGADYWIIKSVGTLAS
jgi:C1A family cysteine protease